MLSGFECRDISFRNQHSEQRFITMNKIAISAVLALLCYGVHSEEVVNVEYGGKCNDTTHFCHSSNIKDPLRCVRSADAGICQCMPEMFRHIELGYCVSPHGEACTPKAGDGLHVRTCTEFAECWINSTSTEPREKGTCYCHPDAKPDLTTGQCKLNYGSTRCKADGNDCDYNSFLTCREGKCVCLDEENQEYDGDKCVALVGGTCGDKANEPKCGANMKCTNTKCECNDGFTSTPDNKCGKGLNGTCKIDSDCHPQFVCTAEKCSCPTGQVEENGKCVVLVGETCSTNSTENPPECVLNSSCKNEKCTCNDGYAPGQGENAKRCIALYGSTCSDSEPVVPCNGNDYLQCNPTSKKCECKENYEADDVNKKCKGKIGQDCNGEGSCAGNAICSSGKCSCNAGEEAFEDRCYKKLGGACTADEECIPGRHLSCRNSTCLCRTPADMHQDTDKCVGKAEKPCLGGDCVGNSTCQNEVCKCLGGFGANEEGMCVQGSGANAFSSSLLGVVGVMLLSKIF